MRDGLDAPTETVPAAELGRLRAYLDRQRPISLAVWVRHAHTGPDGPSHDHHTMLGMDEAAYASADLAALERGLWEECPAPGWLDCFPLPEVEPLRDFGEGLWERGEELRDGLDPLDFALVVEAVDPPPGVADAVAGAASSVRAVRCVDLARESLRKGGREVRQSLRFRVLGDERLPPDDVVGRVSRALRGLGLGNWELGYRAPPLPDPATILYERSEEGAA